MREKHDTYKTYGSSSKAKNYLPAQELIRSAAQETTQQPPWDGSFFSVEIFGGTFAGRIETVMQLDLSS